MTNEQMIEQLKGIRSDYEADCKNSPFKETLYQKDIEAIDVAIKILEERSLRYCPYCGAKLKRGEE